MRHILLLGAGHSTVLKIKYLTTIPGGAEKIWRLDNNDDCNPDILWNLNDLPLPLKENFYDEIHAYEVLEHCGKQGDFKFFFAQFNEFARILKPHRYMIITAPPHNSVWAWGDPGHTRYMGPEVFLFLSHEEYEKQLGYTAMSDYRRHLKSNWRIIKQQPYGDTYATVLQNIKKGGDTIASDLQQEGS